MNIVPVWKMGSTLKVKRYCNECSVHTLDFISSHRFALQPSYLNVVFWTERARWQIDKVPLDIFWLSQFESQSNICSIHLISSNKYEYWHFLQIQSTYYSMVRKTIFKCTCTKNILLYFYHQLWMKILLWFVPICHSTIEAVWLFDVIRTVHIGKINAFVKHKSPFNRIHCVSAILYLDFKRVLQRQKWL